jgi:hypothetical protein
MIKRVVSGALWFVAVGWGLGYVAAFLELPGLMQLTVAVVVAVFVSVDPTHRIWPERVQIRTATRVVPDPVLRVRPNA